MKRTPHTGRSRTLLQAKAINPPPWLPSGWLTVDKDGWTLGKDRKRTTPRDRLKRVRELFLEEMADVCPEWQWREVRV